MRTVEIMVVPYDSASRQARMGLGPHALLRAGIQDRLMRTGLASRTLEVYPETSFHAEIATTFDLQRQVRDLARLAAVERRFALTLSGNCNTGVVGSLAAHGSDKVGLFWFDAHSDAETPETSDSGFLDGMGFAIALGRCWRPQLESLGWLGLPGRRATLIGAREISPAARLMLTEAGVSIVPPEIARGAAWKDALTAAVSQMKQDGVEQVHVHVDLDVLDPDLVGPANDYALPGGLSTQQLIDHLALIVGTFDLASASIASFDPRLDDHGTVAAAGLEVAAVLCQAGCR